MNKKEEIINSEIKRIFGSVQDIINLNLRETEYYRFSENAILLNTYDKTKLEEQLKEFVDCLKSQLDDKNDDFFCDEKCFEIKTRGLNLVYCIEVRENGIWYIAYYKNNKPVIEKLERDSLYEVHNILNTYKGERKEEIYSRMYLVDMVANYKNPIERLLYSMKISEELSGLCFKVRYGGFGYYGSEFCFFKYDHDQRPYILSPSTLFIEEESISYLLPIIEDIYPYIYERYYDDNYIPIQMMRDIVNHVKEVKHWLLDETQYERITKYSERFDLYTIYFGCGESEKDECIINRFKDNPLKYIYQHRFEIARFYDIFISWAEEQFKRYGEEAVFMIQGP